MGDYARTTWQDEVKDAGGVIIQAGTPLSSTNMNNIEDGVEVGAKVAGTLAIMALQHINGIEKDLDKWKNQRLQQGTAYIYNKYVIEGCVVAKMINSRYLQVSRTGTYALGDLSKIHADGKQVGVNDEQMIAMVPLGTGANKDYFCYVDYDSVAARYKVYLAATVPDGKLQLYKVTVPGTDQGTDLTNVTLTDLRRIEPNTNFRTTEPSVFVANPGYTLFDTPDYDVQLTVESASDLYGRIGDLIVYGKASNGFNVKATGNADNIQLRWTIINPNIT